jgi:general secretion pathway protein E
VIASEMMRTGDVIDDLAADFYNAPGIVTGSEDSLALRLIYGIIAEAARQGASAVHLESNGSGLVIRTRVNGALVEKLRLPPQLATVVIRLVKQMSRLDFVDQDLPQDGLVSLNLGGKIRNVGISTLPNTSANRTSERIVLRILDEQITSSALQLLGMSEYIRQILTDALAQPDGLILVCGPAGSGKTATLYAGIKQLNDGTRNILTVENPIEYAVEGTGQTQINTERGLNFANGLRAILRQDPDVVMVGEIADRETAAVAVEASLNGHLVLSAINTNDAVSAIARLRDLHVDPFLMASSLRAIIGQRTVRRLCEHCRMPIQAEGSLASLLGFDRGTVVFRATGCNLCNQTGFQGHIGVFEAIRIDETTRRLINGGGDEARISAHAFYKQPGLASAARNMVQQGVTTAEEGIRISRGEPIAASHLRRI